MVFLKEEVPSKLLSEYKTGSSVENITYWDKFKIKE